MKNAILVFIAFFIHAIGFAQAGPKIEFKAPDNTIDFGKVTKAQEKGLRSFEFTNTGNAPLIILDVLSTCGCLVASKPTTPIMPGKSDKIDIKYSMIPGPIRKTITVETNAINVDSGRIALKVKGEVIPD